MEQPRFRASYDLLLLREQSGEDLGGLSQWWTDFQNANHDTREKMAKSQGGAPKKRRNNRKKAAPPSE